MDFTQLKTKYQLCPNCQQPLQIHISVRADKKYYLTQEQEVIDFLSFQSTFNCGILTFSCSQPNDYFIIYSATLTSGLHYSYRAERITSAQYYVLNIKNSLGEKTNIIAKSNCDQTLAAMDFLIWTDLLQLAQELSPSELDFKIKKTLLLI